MPPFNYTAPFLWILVENRSQDGGQNRITIDKESFQNLIVFSRGFLKHFGGDLGAKMHKKSVQKRSQKDVGIALEVKHAKT